MRFLTLHLTIADLGASRIGAAVKGVLVLAVLAFAGCQGGEPQPPQLPPTLPPLTIEQWKTLPVDEKYDQGTFDRLRDADPKLRSDLAWQKFMKDIVIPERKIDIPGVPGMR